MPRPPHSRIAFRVGSHMLPTDAFFWYAEAATPQLRPLVAGLFALDRAPDHRRFRASIERLVAMVPRLRQRVVEPLLPLTLPAWRADSAFDLNYHLREVVLPPPATQRHLLDFTGAIFSTPLDHLRPLWEAYLIEGLEGGRAALFLKLHHSVMDGVGSVVVFDALSQAQRNDPVHVPRLRDRRSDSAEPLASITQAWNVAAGLAQLVGGAAHALFNPAATITQAIRTGRSAGKLMQDFLSTPADDPLTERCTSVGRRLEAVTLSLPRLRRLKTALGVTLNDVVLTLVAGAVGRYHRRYALALREVPCVVPMNLRQEHERYQLGNRVSAFLIQLPVGDPDPKARLIRIQEQTHAAKSGRSSGSYQMLMNAVSIVPAFAFRALARGAHGRVHLICSNVPGPPVQRYLAGAKITAVHPFAPVLLGTPLSIALVSYGDCCAVGIDSDPTAIPDPERIGTYLEEELVAFERAVFGKAMRARPAKRESRRAAQPINGQHVPLNQAASLISLEATEVEGG